MNWITKRLQEPSTWAGIAGILTAVAAAFPETAYYSGGAAAVCGTIAGIMKEKGAPPPQ